MAIKVKHEGSAASRISASAAGGAAKRAMESAALVKPGQIQTLQAAHASAPGISTPHATLISAPGGGAHAPFIGGGGGVGSTSRVGGGSRQPASAARGTGVGTDYKVTGTDRFSRPDDDSEWDWSRRQWIRRWLPGEKEAEAQKRIGMAQNEVYADRELTTQAAQIAEEQRRNEEYDRRTKAAQDYKAQQEQAALDAENAKYEALNRKHGIAKGTRLSEKDYNDLEAGRSKWGYSRTDQQAIDTINNDMDEARRNGKFTPEELAKAEEEAKAKIGGFQKRLMPNDLPPTAEQIYNSAIDAPDGTRLISNGSGALVAIPGTGPQKEVETPAEKNARVAQERKDKWLDARIDAIMKNGGGTDGDGNPISVPYQQAYDQATKEMAVRFPSAPSVPAPAPQVTGSAPTPTATPTDDPRKKWAQFAD